jgi:cysteine synthase A
MAGAIIKAKELLETIPNGFIPQQFENFANPAIHIKLFCFCFFKNIIYIFERTTGPEIWRDTEGKINILVCGVGTGGTLTGAGRFLKSKNPLIKLVAVEPKESSILSGGFAGPHGIQGIGAGFVPLVYDPTIVDEIFQVSTAESIGMAKRLTFEEGIMSGVSSCAAVYAAVEIAKRKENVGKLIVVVLPDNGIRYLSTPLFSEVHEKVKAIPVSPLKY